MLEEKIPLSIRSVFEAITKGRESGFAFDDIFFTKTSKSIYIKASYAKIHTKNWHILIPFKLLAAKQLKEKVCVIDFP